MKKDVIIKLKTSFEDTRYLDKDTELEFWFARDLQTLLGYSKWENFTNVIVKAKTACKTAGYLAKDHFLEVRKKVQIGAG